MSTRFVRYAAIKVGDTIITGKNHSECLAKLKERVEQGFLTDAYVGTMFVDRKEALKIAKEAGQKINKHSPKDQLLSEDLSEDDRFCC